MTSRLSRPPTLDAVSASLLYREGAMLLDVDRGEFAWQDRRHRVTDLLAGIDVVIAFGAQPGSTEHLGRLFDNWGVPAWQVADTDFAPLRQITHAGGKI